MKTFDVDTMAKHYLIAALWADCPEGTHPRPTKQAKEQARETCAKFIGLIDSLIPEILDCPDYWSHPDCGGKPEAAIGHDLYLTSAGHGAGFWDRRALPDELGDKLTAICAYKSQVKTPEPYFYRGWMYL